MNTSYRTRQVLAVLIMVLAVLVYVIPTAWFINTRDWGVFLILPTPFLVYGLIRLARALERWVRGDTEEHF